jgi:acyl-CoA thioester hydrolase
VTASTSDSIRQGALDSEKSKTVLPVRVRFCETDLMGIVHHGNYLLYFESGRVEWLRRRGITYALWAERGIHLPVVEAQVNYRAPARFDDVLEIETTLSQLRTVSMKFTYRATRDGALIAEGFTRLACVDDKHKLFPLTPEMRNVLLAGEGPDESTRRVK